jgi:type I restriction enzyme, S subunit
MVNLITEHMDILSAAQTQKAKGGRGRGKRSNGQSLHGIKKLRKLILELAVRGKLVPQDPNDEPANVLLEKIAKEKTRLIKKTRIKKQKLLPEIGVDEPPYKIPVSWEWVRLGYLGDWGAGSTPNRKNPAYYGGDMPWLKSGELRDNEHLSSSEETITNNALERCSLRVCQPGDVLIAMYGATIGMLAILENVVTTNQAVCACTCNSGVSNRYLFLMLKAWRSKFTGQGAGGAQPNISKVKIINTIAPLPPLAEQHRIVTKVDELMALCDQLEQQQTDSNATHQTLVDTLLVTLTNAADQRDFAKAWQRIANHFDTLFTTEQSIDQLKQTILQLAVMGKLVPQDPNDEPASVLLEKIVKEKTRLIKAGKIKKEKSFQGIGEDEKAFKLPNRWDWARMAEICTLITDGTHQTPQYTKNGRIFISAQNIKPFKFMPENHRWVSEEDYKHYTKNRKPEQGDILLTRVGAGIGEAAVIDAEAKFAIYVSVGLLKPSKEQIDSGYLVIWINSPSGRQHSERNTYGKGVSQGNLNLSLIRNFAVSIPPLAEQHRIVAKVDELMTLCDTLKGRLNDAQTTQVHLVDTIVEQAVA